MTKTKAAAAGISCRPNRQLRMRILYDEQVREFTEDNEPTHVATFFEDAIRALPYVAVSRNDLEALFKEALIKSQLG